MSIVCLAAPTSAAAGPAAHESIAGGYYPPADAFPWTTALVDPTQPGNDFDRNFCTAVLIAPQRVLTAAHCVVEDDGVTAIPANRVQALVGRRSLLEPSQGERRNVTSVVLHPKAYLPTAQGHVHEHHAFFDLAVLFLDSPVSIPPAPIGNEDDFNDWGIAMGWGHVNYDHREGHQIREPHLKAANLVLQDDTEAAEAFDTASTQHYHPTIHVSADDAPGGSLDCITHGDSGGPLMVFSGGSWKLIGIASFYPHPSVDRDRQCGAGGPFGFAWVAGDKMRDWPLTVRGDEGTRLDLRMTRREVRRYIRRMIRDETNGRIRGLRSRCRRATGRSFRCRLRWRIRRRGYRGKAEFWHFEENGEAYWSYVFKGRRRKVGCRRCRAKRLNW